MTPTVTNYRTTTDIHQFYREDSLRRDLVGEILGIQKQLKEFGKEDELSQQIEKWTTTFRAALKTNEDVKPILRDYIRFMQEMLIDPMSETPLDDQPLLGTDGRTYGSKHLCVYLNSIPEELRNRSPLDPNSELHFSTKPHETALFMIHWLEKHEAPLQYSEKIEQLYSQLNDKQLRFIQFYREDPLHQDLDDEILGIQKQLKDFGKEDELSQQIEKWTTTFRAALKTNEDVKPILREYIRLMQEMLIDPMSQTPLDDQPLLGTDGRTYGSKHLCVYLNSIPEELRNRSPLDPNSELHFSTKPHETALFMIRWLEKHEAPLQYSEKIEQLYSQLNDKQLRFIIPNKKNDQMRRIWIRKQKMDLPSMEAQALHQRLLEKNLQTINLEFNSLNQRVGDFANQMIHEENEIREENQSQFDDLQKRVDQIKDHVQEHQDRIDSINDQIKELDAKILQAKKEDQEIKCALLELEKEIKEKKKEISALCMAAISICGAMVGTWALNGVVSCATGGTAVTGTTVTGVSIGSTQTAIATTSTVATTIPGTSLALKGTVTAIKGGAKVGISVFF